MSDADRMVHEADLDYIEALQKENARLRRRVWWLLHRWRGPYMLPTRKEIAEAGRKAIAAGERHCGFVLQTHRADTDGRLDHLAYSREMLNAMRLRRAGLAT